MQRSGDYIQSTMCVGILDTVVSTRAVVEFTSGPFYLV